MINMDQH